MLHQELRSLPLRREVSYMRSMHVLRMSSVSCNSMDLRWQIYSLRCPVKYYSYTFRMFYSLKHFLLMFLVGVGVGIIK